ncbi:MAG: FtsW/RodA/SpoVE family cell cycle protein, partial [Acidimicrobiales bacterium]
AAVRNRRRNTELAILTMAAVVIVASYVLASLGRLAEIPTNLVPFLLAILGLFLLAHVATRRLAPDADPVLLPVAGLLNGLGYVFIARLNEDLAALQATWTLLGVAAFITTLIVVRRVRWLEQYRYTLMLVGIALLVLPLVPGLGQEINGARIWVALGPVNFQPGEFAKIALAIFFAAYLVEKREVLALSSFRVLGMSFPEARHLGPIVLAWGVSLLVMVAEKDLGSSLLFFMLFVVLLWVATERPSYLAMSVLMFAGGAALSYNNFEHVRQRVDVWLNPFDDPFGDGFQVTQAAFALADGGLTGTGLGAASPNTENIPAVETDFIFAIIGEELGLLGTTAILIAFMLLIGGGLRVAITAERPFDKLLATGLTTLLGVQAFVIIGGVIRLLPLTGVTLPFVSYGGSSLLANWVLLALLLRISDDNVRHRRERAASRPEAVEVP